MHSVSPVHIRVDNNVKNQMVGTNFEDILNKAKKHVKIGSSTIFNLNKNHRINDSKSKIIKNRNIVLNKPRSCSPVKTTNSRNASIKYWQPPPSQVRPIKFIPKSNEQNSRLRAINHHKNEYDHISKKDSGNKSPSSSQIIKKIPPCEVCDEARSRSNSMSRQKDPSFSSISSDSNNSSINKSVGSARSRSLESNSGNNKTNSDMTYLKYPYRTSSKIYQRQNRHNSQESYFGHHNLNDPNLTYIKQYPCLSRSHDSLIRMGQNRFERLPSPINFVPPIPTPLFPYIPTPHFFNEYAHIHQNSNFLSNIHQELLKKLSETESNANNIIHKLTLLKEYLRQEVNKDNLKLTKRIENDRNDLINKIELFEMSNRDLKDVIYDITAVDHFNKKNKANILKSEHDTIELIKQLEASEEEKNHYKKMIVELEQNANVKGSTCEALNYEKNLLTSVKGSLEDNRAHLRRQLLAKESEIQRLNVQLRILNQKFDRAQLEIELLRQNRERAGLSNLKFENNEHSKNIAVSASNNSLLKIKPATINNSNVKLNKVHYNLEEILNDPIKIRLYIDKLNNQIREKDAVIKNQNDLIKKNSESDDHKSERSEKHQAEKLRKEIEKLKLTIQVKDEKLKNAENKIKNDKKLHSSSNSSSNLNKKIPSNQQSLSSSDEAASANLRNLNSTDETQSIQRSKNFAENELNNVRSLLQERINELEPLPELLKNTELKLHDSNLKVKVYEDEISEYKKLVNELRNELDLIQNRSKQINHNSKYFKNQSDLISSTLVSVLQADSNQIARQQNLIENLANANKLEQSLEKKMDHLNDEQKELVRQIALKDEYIRDLTNKLAIKSEEAASHRRQLDLALNDFNIKEKQIKEKFTSKERSLQAKCTELEAKLSTIKLHSNVDKRDKEDLAEDYQIQIKDLKQTLNQTQIANKQMQDYVNFLKNTYVTYFNENSLQNFDYSSSNFYTSQNNLI